MKAGNILVGLACVILFSVTSCATVKNQAAEKAENSYILNVTGSAQYRPDLWKPHSVGFVNAKWSITFTDRVTMYLDNASEFGHIACGSWWEPNFLYRRKLPLRNVRALVVSVDVSLAGASYNAAAARLRMAVAGAIAMPGASRYTELDFWDSPAARGFLYPRKNKYCNGSDEYSYQICRVQPGRWMTFANDFLPYMKESRGDLSEAFLECIYVVIESDCRERQSEDTVSLEVRNLSIRVEE